MEIFRKCPVCNKNVDQHYFYFGMMGRGENNKLLSVPLKCRHCNSVIYEPTQNYLSKVNGGIFAIFALCLLSWVGYQLTVDGGWRFNWIDAPVVLSFYLAAHYFVVFIAYYLADWKQQQEESETTSL